MSNAEIGVIGLGAVGSQVLRHLAARGVSAIGFDQTTSPNDRSGHAGETRLINVLSEPAEDGAPDLHGRAIDAWTRFERETGHTVLTRNGGLSIGYAGTPMMQSLIAAARRRHGDDRAVLSPTAIADRFPQFKVASDELGVFDELASGVRSEFGVSGAVQLAQRNGATVKTNDRVLGWTTDDRGVRVYCAHGDYRFSRIVVTAGAFIGDLLPELPVRARRLVMAWFAPETSAIAMYSRADMPIFTVGSVQALGEFVYGAPSLDRPYVKVGGDFDWGYADPPKSMDFAVTDADLVGLRAKARAYFHGLTDSVVRSIKLMDGWTPDARPLIGWHDDSARVMLATGFSGDGFAISPVIGEIVADLVTGAESRDDLRAFDPHRFSADERRPALTGVVGR